MFQWFRDWWTLQLKSAHSPEYDEAMERRMPGFRAIQAGFAADAKQRHEMEEAWWREMVALQDRGQVAEAVRRTQANIDELSRYVLDPFERIAMLYARDVDRLLVLGNSPEAKLAANEAIRWMSIWASGSTSGGEGTARSNAMSRMDAELQGKLNAAR